MFPLLTTARQTETRDLALPLPTAGTTIAWLPWAFFAFGVMIRVWYCFTHDYLAFGHDAHAHVEHINYVALHGRMAPPDGGWEFYQPPAYYWLSALVVNAGASLGWTQTSCLKILQWASCFSASAVLACVLYVSGKVFPDHRSLVSRSLFVGIIAVIPGMVFLSSQINNDVPAQLIFFLGMCVLLRWWQRPSLRQVIVFALLSGVGILTKTNCVLMLPIALVALLCRPGMPLRLKSGVVFLTAAIVLCVSGWFVLPRGLDKSNVKDYVVSNYTRIPASMLVKNDAASLLTFDPIQVMRVPYNDSWKDTSRRQFAPEYLFKSIFFGEFDFGEREKSCARIMLLSSMILVFAAISNAIITFLRSNAIVMSLHRNDIVTAHRAARETPLSAWSSTLLFPNRLVRFSALLLPHNARRSVMGDDALRSPDSVRVGVSPALEHDYWRALLPLWSSALILYVALIANRFLYPYAVCGDFRFVTPIVLGCGVFMVLEHRAMPACFKQITRVCSIVFILSSVWFLASITF